MNLFFLTFFIVVFGLILVLFLNRKNSSLEAALLAFSGGNFYPPSTKGCGVPDTGSMIQFANREIAIMHMISEQGGDTIEIIDIRFTKIGQDPIHLVFKKKHLLKWTVGGTTLGDPRFRIKDVKLANTILQRVRDHLGIHGY